MSTYVEICPVCEEPTSHHRPWCEVGYPSRRTSWTATDLIAATFPDARCAVDGLIPEGLTFMCGAPKLGKSFMALGLGIAVASGGMALGTVGVERGSVLYLALEDSPRRLQSRLRTALEGGPAPEGLYVETKWPRLNQGGAERIEAWLEQQDEPRLVIADTWPKIRAEAERHVDHFKSDYDAAGELQHLALTHEVAMVALAHTRKAEAEDFVETVTGTFGTAAAADTIIVIKRSRGQADATLYVTGRDVEEQEVALRFTPRAGAWAIIGDAAEYALGETRKLMLDTVREHRTVTPKQAASLAGVTHDLARQTLSRMARDGQIKAEQGSYSLLPPVTPVTESLLGDGVTPVTGVLRENGEGPTEALVRRVRHEPGGAA